MMEAVFTWAGFVLLFVLVVGVLVISILAGWEMLVRKCLIVRVQFDVLEKLYRESSGLLRSNQYLRRRLNGRWAQKALEEIAPELDAAVSAAVQDIEYNGRSSVEELPEWAKGLVLAAWSANAAIAQVDERTE